MRGLRIAVIDARGTTGVAAKIGKKAKLDFWLDKSGRLELDQNIFYLRDLGLERRRPDRSISKAAWRRSSNSTTTFSSPIHKNIFYVEKKAEGVESVEVALQYVDDISARILGFANNIYNPEGGTHVTGFKTALTRTLNSYAKKNNLAKDGEDNFTGDDVARRPDRRRLRQAPRDPVRRPDQGQARLRRGAVSRRHRIRRSFSAHFSKRIPTMPAPSSAKSSSP